MATSKVRVEVGFVSIPARMEKATDEEESGFRTVCTGVEHKHDPARVKMHVDCPACGLSRSSVFAYPDRAIEVGDELRVVTKEQIAEASGAPIKTMSLRFHDREKFFAATVAADSVQNLSPDKGGERGFTALVEVLRRRPDLVAVTIYAPRSKNALWVLDVHENRLVASKRCWPEDVRPVAAVTPAPVTDVETDLLGQFVDASVEDFDLGEYVNARQVGVKALVAGATAATAATVAAAPAPSDLMAALQANIAAAVAPAKPRSTRKAPAKKVPAKKAASRKRTVPLAESA